MPHCNKLMLSFFLTTKCNLCCRYCYNATERNAITETILLHATVGADIVDTLLAELIGRLKPYSKNIGNTSHLI